MPREGLVREKKITENMWSKIVYIWAGRELDIKTTNNKQSSGRGVIETGSDPIRGSCGQKSFRVQRKYLRLK